MQVPGTERHGLRHVSRRVHRIYSADAVERSTVHENASTKTVIQFPQLRAVQQPH